jgi:hypothetical protein
MVIAPRARVGLRFKYRRFLMSETLIAARNAKAAPSSIERPVARGGHISGNSEDPMMEMPTISSAFPMR